MSGRTAIGPGSYGIESQDAMSYLDGTEELMFELNRRRSRMTPIEELHWAVLDQAMADLKRPKPLSADAEAWILGIIDSVRIPFATVCQVLNVTESGVRDALLKRRRKNK